MSYPYLQTDPYVPGSRIGRWVVVLLFASIVSDAIAILTNSAFLVFGDVNELSAETASGELSPSLLLVMLVGLAALLRVFVFLVTVVVFLIWLHRVNKNLTPLRAQFMENSPGWAVGWWFIPFANLVKPFQVVREVWNKSKPEYTPDVVMGGEDYGTPALLGVWWAFWLLANFTGQISFRLPDQYFVEGLWADSINALLSLIAAILLLQIVKGINQRQDARFAVINQMPNAPASAAPPPPPVFHQT